MGLTRVTVDGVDYVPAGHSFGVAITTRNRPERLGKSLAAWRKHTPSGVPIIVVDDESTTPTSNADYRFTTNVGIATAKNKCLELLLAAGVEHLFLADDDAYPVADGWWVPYVESPEPHLFAVFTSATAKSSRIDTIYTDSTHTAYAATRGYFLYFHRSVIDRVGGFDTRFKNAFEHVELSNRIHNAGLTTWPYQDVTGSNTLIFCEDQAGNTSVIPDGDRRANEATGRQLLEECAGRDTFVPFGSRDVVLSCLFVTKPDPQRGNSLAPNPDLAGGLLKSLDGDTIVFCDFDTDHQQFHRVEVSENPYIQRWITYRQYLVAHPEIRWVWCVDATDVQALRDPFEDMQPGILYTGWENQILGCAWMLKHHQASRAWIEVNRNLPLLNAGVAGGDRQTMLTFTDRLIHLWVAAKRGHVEDRAGDMGFFNRAAHGMNVITGPPVTTLFKAEQRNDYSIWKHK